MRIVPIECVRSGSYLGKTIYDDDGRILLKKGILLKDTLLRSIKQNKISQIYIIDEYSSIEINDVIRPELRQKSIRILKDVFTSVTNTKEKDILVKRQSYIDSISNISDELLNNILSNDKIMLSLVDIKSMDNYTYQHSVNVAIISTVIGIGLDLPKYELKNLCIGALLHDIGKVFIPGEIIKKPSSLTDEEFDMIRTHPQKGYDYLFGSYGISSSSKLIIKQHHERYDGFGYPNKLSGEDIFRLARIVSVADVYDALTSNRPYRRPISANDAVEYIMAHSDTLFDHKIVKAFSKFIVPYPIGTIVVLSNDEIAIVEENNYKYPLRPIVKILKSPIEKNINKVIDLLYELSTVIIDIQYYI